MSSEDETTLWFTAPRRIPAPFIHEAEAKMGAGKGLPGENWIDLISAFSVFRCQEVKWRLCLKMIVFVCFTIMIVLSLPVKRGFTLVWV